MHVEKFQMYMCFETSLSGLAQEELNKILYLSIQISKENERQDVGVCIILLTITALPLPTSPTHPSQLLFCLFFLGICFFLSLYGLSFLLQFPCLQHQH